MRERRRARASPVKKGEAKMRLRPPAFLAVLAIVLLGATLWADQIILKDGTVYSGKFIRGDSKEIDFRVLGRIETFKIADIAQIVFKEPELETPANARVATPAPAQPQAPPPEPQPRTEAVAQTQTPSMDVRPQSPVTQGSDTNAAPSNRSSSTGVTFPVGTPVTIRTSTQIDTDRNRVGDAFDASLDEALMSGNQVIAPRGAAVKGRISYAKESGKLSGQAQLMLELTDLIVNGKSYMLRTSDYSEVGASRTNRTAATVGGTAALGAIIGAIAGGGTGAAVGAASGAAVGTGVQVLTKGQVLKIPAETIIEFRLESPLTVDAP
jgi:hypothetical protein